jgi:hypothetical protein
MSRSTISEAELRAWITGRIQGVSGCEDLVPKFTIVKVASIPNWEPILIQNVEDFAARAHACRTAFHLAVAEALGQFDIT